MTGFQWDAEKAKANLRKHGVAFAEAAWVFLDPLSVTIHDPDHSESEDRYLTVGASASGRLLIVGHTNRGDQIRIVSARRLTRTERKEYEDEIQERQG